jgi:hypothetical protein
MDVAALGSLHAAFRAQLKAAKPEPRRPLHQLVEYHVVSRMVAGPLRSRHVDGCNSRGRTVDKLLRPVGSRKPPSLRSSEMEKGKDFEQEVNLPRHLTSCRMNYSVSCSPHCFGCQCERHLFALPTWRSKLRD